MATTPHGRRNRRGGGGGGGGGGSCPPILNMGGVGVWGQCALWPSQYFNLHFKAHKSIQAPNGIGSFVRNFHIGFDPDYECH